MSKKKIKDLTMDEMCKICAKQSCSCKGCPLLNKSICYRTNYEHGLQKLFKTFSEKEIEVEDE